MRHHNFVVVARMIMKFVIDTKLYNCSLHNDNLKVMTSPLLHIYDVITKFSI